MALDYGARTVGVAVSDELLLTAQPREIIRRERENKLRKTLTRIGELIQEYRVGVIVLGLPLNMDDSAGARAQASCEFQKMLEERFGLPVVLSDERLTTVEADELMSRMDIRGKDRKEYVDMLAANVILQEYLENHREQCREILGRDIPGASAGS